MIAQGHVENGVVILDSGSQFPDGQKVIVLASSTESSKRHSVLEIPTVSVGEILDPGLHRDEILDEMLGAEI
jgi:hypothetical protein